MGKFYTIGTFHHSQLLANTSSGRIVAGVDRTPQTMPVIAYISAPRAGCAFLSAGLPSDLGLTLLPLEAVGQIVPVGVTEETADGTVAFYSPWTALFLLVAPHQSATEPGSAILAAVEPQAYEKLYLQPVEERLIPGRFIGAARLLDRVSRSASRVDDILSLVMNEAPGAVTRDVLNAAGLLLSRVQLESLGKKLLDSAGSISRLRAHFPNDLAAQYAIEPLVDWLRSRGNFECNLENYNDSQKRPSPGKLSFLGKLFSKTTKDVSKTDDHGQPSQMTEPFFLPPVRKIGKDLDSLDTVGIGGSFVSLPHACNFIVRTSVKSRRRACVLATARNEGLYLLEWIAHHRALGFEGFFIYTNDNIDASDNLLQSLAESGEIVWIKNTVGSGTKPQWKSYNHALQVVPDILDYDWALVIDLDEQFSLNRRFFTTVQKYLDWCERISVDAIGFNWLVVGSNGQTHWREETLRRRFPSAANGHDLSSQLSPFIKSMFRIRKFPVSMPHHPVRFWDDHVVLRAPSMRMFRADQSLGSGMSETTDGKMAWITHYFYKSNEEFVFKFSRARGDDPAGENAEFSALTREFIVGFVTNAVLSASPHEVDELDKTVDEILRFYLSKPSTRLAYEAVKEFYSSRLESLLPRLVTSSAIDLAGDAGEAFLTPLRADQKHGEHLEQ